MIGKDFYHSLTKKYITAFGILFNNINIFRTEEDGTEIQKMKVPLSYASKEKMLARLFQDPTITKPAAITLPRMSFELVNYQYDGNRHLNRLGRKVVAGEDANHMKTVLNPVAYDFSFNLYVYVKYNEDGSKILEQILPFFTPDFTVSVSLIEDMDIVMDIPVVYSGMNIVDQYEGSMLERKVLIYTLSFTVKGYLWGPLINKPIIKFVKTHAYVGNTSDNSGAIERVAVYPGLDANGDATTNADITIDVNLINYDDPYGFITVVNVNQPFSEDVYPFNIGQPTIATAFEGETTLKAASLSGTPSGLLSCSAWIRPRWDSQGNRTPWTLFQAGAVNGVRPGGSTVYEDTDGTTYVYFRDSTRPGNGNGKMWYTSETVLQQNVWSHILVSVDTTGDDYVLNFYVNDQPISLDVGFTDGSLPHTLDTFFETFYVHDWMLTPPDTQPPIQDMYDFWLADGQFIDFSVEANRRKFITADLQPVNLGGAGLWPTGVAPTIFLHGGRNDFVINKGDGGDLTLTGPVANTDGPPSS